MFSTRMLGDTRKIRHNRRTTEAELIMLQEYVVRNGAVGVGFLPSLFPRYSTQGRKGGGTSFRQ